MKKPSPVEILAIAVIVLVLAAILIPALMHARALHGSGRTLHGAPTVLRQVYAANSDYIVRQGKLPASLDDLIGHACPDAAGERTVFSVEALEQELGANRSVVCYLPRLQASDAPLDEVILAYIPVPNDTNFCDVVFRNGKIKRLRSAEVQNRIDRLKKLVNEK